MYVQYRGGVCRCVNYDFGFSIIDLILLTKNCELLLCIIENIQIQTHT